MSWLTDLLDPRPPRRREFGGWTYDAAAATLVRADGARLRFIGSAADDAALSLHSTGNRRWLRFDLRLGSVAYPLLVERRDVLDLLSGESGSRRLVWRLDHLRSARLRGAEPPEPALWREVDCVALDALCCWPERSTAGVRPADVAVSGGWRDGRWTAAYFRAFSDPGMGVHPCRRGSEHVPLGAPRRWEYAPAERPQSPADAAATFRAFAAAGPSEIAALVPALARGRPHLRSARTVLVPLLVDSHPRSPQAELTVRWLYADEAMITDRLRCTASRWSAANAPVWGFEFEQRECLVGTVDRPSGAYVDFARLAEGYAERTTRKGAFFAEYGSFPETALAKFREVVAEALWCWEEVTLALPDRNGAAADVRVAPPAVGSLWPAMQYDGGKRATRMQAAPSVGGAAGYVALAAMFADDDGYAPAARAPRVGRLDFDGAANAMIDGDARRTLAFDRTLEGSADAAGEQLGLFRYADAEGAYPVVVGRLARTRPDAAGEWILDHEASAARWRAETGADGAPPQTRWRRIAAFTFDALLAWPDTMAFGPAPAALVATGGWWNGRWTPTVRRRGTTRLLQSRARESLWARAGVAPPRYWSSPAEVARTPGGGGVGPEPTQSWHRGHHDAPDDDSLPMLALDPPDAVVVEAVDLVAVAANRLHGRPYWLRADGGALLYVCGYEEQNVGPEYAMEMRPVYEYADADVRVRLRVAGSRGQPPLWLDTLRWPRVVRTSAFATAGGELPPELFLLPAGSGPSWQPHPRLWYRLVDAAEARLDPGRTGRRAAVVTHGAYVADAFDHHADRSVWIDGPD